MRIPLEKSEREVVHLANEAEMLGECLAHAERCEMRVKKKSLIAFSQKDVVEVEHADCCCCLTISQEGHLAADRMVEHSELEAERCCLVVLRLAL